MSFFLTFNRARLFSYSLALAPVLLPLSTRTPFFLPRSRTPLSHPLLSGTGYRPEITTTSSSMQLIESDPFSLSLVPPSELRRFLRFTYAFIIRNRLTPSELDLRTNSSSPSPFRHRPHYIGLRNLNKPSDFAHTTPPACPRDRAAKELRPILTVPFQYYETP